MKEFVEYIIKNLVDFPDDVHIREIESEHTCILEIHMQKKDIGKVVGKKGQNINALRTLVQNLAYKNEMRVLLEIIE